MSHNFEFHLNFETLWNVLSLNVSLEPSKCLQSLIETIKMGVGQVKYFHIILYPAKKTISGVKSV